MFQVFNALKLLRHFRCVCHQHERHVFFAASLANQIDHLLLMPGIDIRRRFIGQKQFRFVGQGSRDRDTLLFADRKLRRFVREAFPQADAIQQMPRPLGMHAAAGERHSQEHIFQRREGRQ